MDDITKALLHKEKRKSSNGKTPIKKPQRKL